MQKLIAIFVVSFLLLTFSSTVFAKDDATGSSKPKFEKSQKFEKFLEKRADFKVDFQQKKEQVKEKFASKSAELRQKRADHIKKILGLVFERMQAANERLDKVSERIQTRIDKIKARGVDVGTAQAALDSCDAKALAVDSSIAIAKTSVDSLNASSEDFKSQIEAVHSSLKNVKLALVDYHTCLRNTLATIKAITPKEAAEGED